jgi:predicted acetyltransferase
MAADAILLSNLLELYIHDLSAIFAHVELDADGRFGYARLPLYFAEPERRLAFVIRSGGRVAGFALAKRGSPAVSDPDVLDIAEFFVLRRYRRSGIGRQAALLLWKRLPGRWTVRVSEGNGSALEFWRDVVAGFTHGSWTELVMSGDQNAWRVFMFESAPETIPN